MKSKISFVCQECGYESPQWLGKCPECGMWNSLREISNIKYKKSKIGNDEQRTTNLEPKKLKDIKFEEKLRIKTSFLEFDGVLGGGIVRGSVILLAGDPGVGKSTLLLQIALNLSNNKVVLNEVKDPIEIQNKRKKEILRSAQNDNERGARPVLYISGEESEEQIKLRAERINPSIHSASSGQARSGSNMLVLSTTNTDSVVDVIQKSKPALVIVDSIQTMESENVSGISGSVGQVRYSAFQFIKLAKTQSIPVIIVGHVTKEGMVAGPMVLSHMVDTVLFLEGEKFTKTRILRSFKNRFGPVDEVGIFTMDEYGMGEVKNIDQLFLTKNIDNKVTGSIISVAMEGTRALLVEIQALVIPSKLPIPRRVAQGIDYKRLELLLAVIQKHCAIPLSGMDIFVNIAGGIKVSDPGIDLGICMAIISSFRNISLSETVAVSEIGLLGELRKVSFLDKRIKEAKKLGFKDIISLNKFKTLKSAVNSIRP